jgi:two-component system CAI-1 autoinducer sensor kinase/phosphatase CqsS
VIELLTKSYRRLYRSVAVSSVYAIPKMFFFGAVAAAGFPLYYYVWVYLFPQPYENLSLRLAGSVIAAPLLFTKHWPSWTRSILPVYWFFVLTFCLPFFFTYMLLQNGVDSVWPMSAIAAVLLLFVVVDSFSAIVIEVVGVSAAFGIFTIHGGDQISWAEFSVLVPVVIFALVTGVAFNLGNEREQRARSLAARALGAYVAHELGNPLTTISASAKETKEYVPALVDTYRTAKRLRLDVPPISESHLEFLERVGNMTQVEVDYSLMIIDMVLKKAGAGSARIDEQEELGILGCAQRAVDNYAFKSSQDRERVRIDKGADFAIYANDTLLRHVLFNLLQNALYAIKAARRHDTGVIRVWAVPGHRTNCLHVRDNGVGMSREIAARAFDPFFTTRDRGTGLGLHFCRDVMQQFGGDIYCKSSADHFTEFILSFPATRRGVRPVSTLVQEPDVPFDAGNGNTRGAGAPSEWHKQVGTRHHSAV